MLAPSRPPFPASRVRVVSAARAVCGAPSCSQAAVPTVTGPLPSMGRGGAVTSRRRPGRGEAPGNVGQGAWRSWRGRGLGGGQSQRAAASALGNIVFSWLLAQDMHSPWTPPSRPPPDKTSRQPSCPKARDSWREDLGGRGPRPPSPTPGPAWLPFRNSRLPALAVLGTCFSLLSCTVHTRLARSQRARARGTGRPRFWQATDTFAPSQGPPWELESKSSVPMAAGPRGREEGQPGQWV